MAAICHCIATHIAKIDGALELHLSLAAVGHLCVNGRYQ
jgi:hypothetical protein